LLAKLAGMLLPPNFVVASRNVLDITRREPWTNAHARPSDRLSHSAQSALGWISRSQDKVGSGGIGSYDFSGWSRGYPEVTGYIIPTFWDYAAHTEHHELRDRAIMMAEWLLR